MVDARHHRGTVAEARRLFERGLPGAAEEMARGILRAQPRNVDALVLLALMARSRHDLAEVDRLSTAALEVRPGDRYVRLLHAQNLYYMGDAARAHSACERAAELFPGDQDFTILRAMVHENRLQFQEAWAVIDPLLKAGPQRAEAYALAGRALHGLGRYQEAIDRMAAAAKDPRHPAYDRRRIWFQLFKTFDRIGEYDRAMEACATAHGLQPARFDPSAFAARVEDTIQAYAASAIRGLARSSNASEAPVFIVGMPRSGTTLVEQIIDAHPSAFGAGELMDIPHIAQNITVETGSMHAYPAAVADLTSQSASAVAQRHLARLAQLSVGALRVVDKMPHNYEHVGLIWQLFPGARVIHLLRDPLDTCLSCYTRQLSPELVPYAGSLEHLGFVYRQHQRLMEHWKQTLDLPILTVQYEELVADQERVTRQIIDFLGLPWDARCLRYWEADRTVMTLSYDQVNKPIYDSSIGRWKNYSKHLGPLMGALDIEAAASAADRAATPPQSHSHAG